jgi:hypothetical protein
MSRDHYKGVPKKRNVVVNPDGLLDIEAIVKPSVSDNTSISGTALKSSSRLEHVAMAPAGALRGGSNFPDLHEYGPLAYLEFNQVGDRAYKVYKIDDQYTGNTSIHIHWTKSDDVDRSGQFSRWQIDYVFYAGNGGVVNSGTNTIDTGDLEYLDSATDHRVVYRTPDLTISGAQPGYYLSTVVRSITPSGTELSNPGLVSLDLMYERNINDPDA